MGEIRRGRASDRDDVVRLWMDLLRSQAALDERFTPADDAQVRWRNDFGEWLDRQSRRLFVATVDGMVCGFITAERSSPAPIFEGRSEVYIDELFVEPEYRRRAIGTELVQTVREWAESIGAERIRAGLLAANEEGRTFWKHVGGEPITVTIGIELSPSEIRSAAPSERRRIGF